MQGLPWSRELCLVVVVAVVDYSSFVEHTALVDADPSFWMPLLCS